MKIGKALGIDGIMVEMLKYGEDVILEWILWMCSLAWEQGEAPEKWRQAITIVPLNKGKGSRSDCNSYTGISLLCAPRKVCGRVLNERMMKLTDESIGDKHTIVLKMIAGKHLGKDRKLHAAFMDLGKAYDGVDKKGLWDVQRICSLDGQLLKVISSFFKDT